ncbi:MAG TPA: tyrosine-protein phosphatase [Acidimicrobiales bacterium]
MAHGVVNIHLERAGEGQLKLAWDLDAATAEGGELLLDIAFGPTPQAIDHEHHATVPAAQGHVQLATPPSERTYVSVAPQGTGPAVVVSERRVPFEGVTNFRDLGGYPTASGGHTRWGHLFRADALHRFTAEDRLAYERLGVVAVYDLRGDAEAAVHPNPVPSILLPVLSRGEGVEADAPAAPLVDRADGEQLLRNLYGGMLAHAGPTFGELFRAFADLDGRPAVFHCTGGKDRTGMSAALLLELLGVARSDVLDDYELTSAFRRREHQGESYDNMVAMGLAPEAAAAVLGTPRWAMEEALVELDETYGGIEAFLTRDAQLEPAVLERLRSQLAD